MSLEQISKWLSDVVLFLISPASVEFGEFIVKGPAIFVVPTAITIIGLSIWSFIWLFRDARKRQKNGFLAIVFILMTGWPLSFIWWMWLRPDPNQQAN